MVFALVCGLSFALRGMIWDPIMSHYDLAAQHEAEREKSGDRDWAGALAILGRERKDRDAA